MQSITGIKFCNSLLATLRLETPDFTWPIRGLMKSGVSRRNVAKSELQNLIPVIDWIYLSLLWIVEVIVVDGNITIAQNHWMLLFQVLHRAFGSVVHAYCSCWYSNSASWHAYCICFIVNVCTSGIRFHHVHDVRLKYLSQLGIWLRIVYNCLSFIRSIPDFPLSFRWRQSSARMLFREAVL